MAGTATGYPATGKGTNCLICNTTNLAGAVLCSECSAPMALVHDSLAQDREPQIVSVIGESNVGKTVYLGFLLDMLSQRAGEFEAIPKGAYSIDLQQSVIAHMARRSFPPKTPMEANRWYWAYYQVRQPEISNKWADLVMPDMAGESLAAEVASPETFRVIRGLLSQSAGLLLLVDAGRAANCAADPDFFGLKMLSYIDALHGPGRDARVSTPTAVVLCKSDYCPECFDNPREFVSANMNRLWNLCQSRFDNVEFFACSVVGSLAYATSPDLEYVIPVPLHTALRGVLEPFEWVLSQL
ncbi:MAG TPA: hypothetical protein PK184_13005 [Phycisphaerae bacterium]|nr:hypothetical protein [Phycisphaerae bacterium]